MSLYNSGTGRSIYNVISALSNELIQDIQSASFTYNVINSNTFETFSYSNTTLNLSASNSGIMIGGNYGTNYVNSLYSYGGSAVNAISTVNMLSNLGSISNISLVNNLYGSSNIWSDAVISNAYLTSNSLYNPTIGNVYYQNITQTDYNNANIYGISNISVNSATLIQNSSNIYVDTATNLTSNSITGISSVVGNIQYGSISNITNCQLTYNPRVMFSAPTVGALVDKIQFFFDGAQIPSQLYNQTYPLLSFSFENTSSTTVMVVYYQSDSFNVSSVSMPIQ